MTRPLPPGWARATLGDIGKYLNGRGFNKSEWGCSGRPIIRIQNLTGSSDHYNYFDGGVESRNIVQPDDLLVSWSATLKVFVWQGVEAVLNQHIFKVESLIQKTFHRWLLEYVLDDLNQRAHGSGIVHITKPKFERTEITIPPLAEQERIVAAIEEHFARLNAAESTVHQTLKSLNTLRSSILADAFHANRELPEEWRISTLGAIFQIVSGATPRTDIEEYWDGEIPWITPDDLSRHDDMYITAGRRSITSSGYASTSTHMLPTDSILFSSRAPIGYVAIASNPVCTNQGFKSLIPPSNVDSRFTYWYLRHMTPQIREMGSGTTFREISKKGMAVIPFLLAPQRDQRRVACTIEEQFSEVDRLSATIAATLDKITAARRSVLAAAFSGRLVPQNPEDEPASVLLEHIARSRPAKPARRRTRA